MHLPRGQAAAMTTKRNNLTLKELQFDSLTEIQCEKVIYETCTKNAGLEQS